MKWRVVILIFIIILVPILSGCTESEPETKVKVTVWNHRDYNVTIKLLMDNQPKFSVTVSADEFYSQNFKVSPGIHNFKLYVDNGLYNETMKDIEEGKTMEIFYEVWG